MAESTEVLNAVKNGDNKQRSSGSLNLSEEIPAAGGETGASTAAAAPAPTTETAVKKDEGSLHLAEPDEVRSKDSRNEIFGDQPIICERCVLEEEAVAFCKNCKDYRYLCDDCYRDHGMQRMTADHKVIESPRIQELRNLYYCIHHPGQNLDYFCKTCSSAICRYCLQASCDGHETLLEHDVREELKVLLGGVKANRSAYCEHADTINQVMVESAEAVQRCTQEVNSIFECLMQELDRKKTEVLTFLKDKTVENIEKNKDQKSHIANKIEGMEKAIADTESLLRSKRTSRIMASKMVTCAKLEGWAMQAWDKKFAVYQSWKMSHKPETDYANQFGNLIPKPRPKDVIIGGLINQQVKVGITNTFTVTVRNISDQLMAFSDSEATEFITIRIIFKENNNPNKHTLLRHNKQREGSKWTVSYFVRYEGAVTISVTVCGEMVQQPFTLHTTRVELRQGDRVTRNPDDWTWDNQDSGQGNPGTVTSANRQGWVTVKWDSNPRRTFDYRWGDEGCYDLKYV